MHVDLISDCHYKAVYFLSVLLADLVKIVTKETLQKSVTFTFIQLLSLVGVTNDIATATTTAQKDAHLAVSIPLRGLQRGASIPMSQHECRGTKTVQCNHHSPTNVGTGFRVVAMRGGHFREIISNNRYSIVRSTTNIVTRLKREGK